MSGYFITFEGSEGCGKTTQIEALAKALEAQGKTVLITREPGGTLIGEKIRNLLQDPSHKNEISDMAELLLFSASRAELIASRIQPALKRGEIVICDRFYDSTYVYQGLGRAIGMEIVEQLNQITVGTLKPDLPSYWIWMLRLELSEQSLVNQGNWTVLKTNHSPFLKQ